MISSGVVSLIDNPRYAMPSLLGKLARELGSVMLPSTLDNKDVVSVTRALIEYCYSAKNSLAEFYIGWCLQEMQLMRNHYVHRSAPLPSALYRNMQSRVCPRFVDVIRDGIKAPESVINAAEHLIICITKCLEYERDRTTPRAQPSEQGRKRRAEQAADLVDGDIDVFIAATLRYFRQHYADYLPGCFCTILDGAHAGKVARMVSWNGKNVIFEFDGDVRHYLTYARSVRVLQSDLHRSQ